MRCYGRRAGTSQGRPSGSRADLKLGMLPEAMVVHLTRVTRYSCRLTGAFAFVMLLPGCAGRDTDGVLVSGRQRATAMLAAARVNRINMFGDVAYGHMPTYFTRTVVSLMQHTYSEVGADTDPDVDHTGKRLVFASTRHSVQPDLYIKSVGGVAVTQLTSDPASDIQPAFSPGGKRVAFASNRAGNWDIWIMEVGGGPPMQVTAGLADEVHPSWSADGTKLVFCSLPAATGQWELWIVDAASGATKQYIGYGLFPEWSPAGDAIVYQRARERDSRWFSIWTLTLVNGEPGYPTEVASNSNHAAIMPSWSTVGKRISYVTAAAARPEPYGAVWSDTDEVFDVWVVAADGLGKKRLTDGHTANTSPVFSQLGRVFFTSNRSGHENIWSLELDTHAMDAVDHEVHTSVDVQTGEDKAQGSVQTVSRRGGL